MLPTSKAAHSLRVLRKADACSRHNITSSWAAGQTFELSMVAVARVGCGQIE